MSTLVFQYGEEEGCAIRLRKMSVYSKEIRDAGEGPRRLYSREGVKGRVVTDSIQTTPREGTAPDMLL